MVSIPAISHVLPSLEVIRELVARGHRVTYANDPQMEEVVTGAGAEFVGYSTTLPIEEHTHDWPDDPVAAMDIFLDDAIAMLPQLRAAYEDDRPDLFLLDIAGLPARILAEQWNLPAVQLSPTYVAWDGIEDEVGAHLKQLPGADAHIKKYRAWLTEYGVEVSAAPDAFFAQPPTRTLALIPRAMQPHAEGVDPELVTFVGPCIGDRSEQGTWTRPAGAENVLLISFGSAITNQPDFYRECLSAFGDLPGWHVVLQIGRELDPADLGDIPDNVEVHPWVPQVSILEQADAFITHAGMGGSSEGLYCGVPMIAVPQMTDGFNNADHLVEAGVARRLDNDEATAETLRSTLLELTSDPQVAESCAAARRELREEGGTQRAADIIEKMLT
ncbi:glycosyl transferase [Nocardiopsis gilva YIM 90087]|uniref:Glycosyl transferase n=1 Tax=Nocardiopsis gilva YIM 90087 TaxID=1235441 RepID=A0A223SDM5_9ACTN|nr:glycosyl transferase [Nocardiopsis gilva YIM 90087]